MPKTPVLTSKELIRMLLSNGFVLDRVKGSHHIYLQPELKRRVVVPMHKSDLPRGTLLSILKQAGIDKGNL
jgi:predicted RNA binding protein YcfA (HicA-like mRNA interferase family)